MTEPMTDTLRRALTHEPALTVSLDDVMRGGRRLRRHQRASRVAGVAATAALLGGAALWFPWHAPASIGTTPVAVAAAGSSESGATGSAASDPGALAPNGLARTVEAAAPAHLTIHWSPGASEGGVDGTITVAGGTTGFSVGISTSSQQVHPCRDQEFTAAAGCTERRLPGGAVLSLRGLSDEPGGLHSIAVVLTYPDGSGVNGGAVNATMSEPDCVSADHVAVSCYAPGAQVTQKPVGPTVTATAPALTIDDLVAIVTAVDGARQH